MEAHLIQGSPDWLALRKTKITASDAASICGKNPYKSAYQLWMEKTDRAPAVKHNEAMQHGIDNEPRARARLMVLTGKDLLPKVYLKDDKYMASLDAVTFEEDEIFEIKCPGAANFSKWTSTKDVPLIYIYQIMMQMYVSGIHKATFAFWRDGLMDTISVPYDKVLMNDILYHCEEFWQCMQNDIPPAIAPSEHVFNDTPEFGVCAIEYAKAFADRKKAEGIERECKERLLDTTDGGNACNDQVKITYISRKGSVDMEALCKHYSIGNEDLDKFRKGSIYYPNITII